MSIRFCPFFLALSMACARIVAPGGGPVDLTGPELISVEPEPGPGYPDLTEVLLTFSERLSPPSIEIPVYPSVQHRTRLRGSEVRILLDRPLGTGTIVLHIPSTIKDARGNELESAADLVFSGLDSLGSATVTLSMSRQGGGSLYANQVLIEVFGIDSVLIRRTEPDSTASATIAWLEPGSYRILCYEDPDRSFTWERENEAGSDTTIALVADSEFILTPVLTVVDTTGPGLVNVEAIDSYHIKVLFNEEVSYESLSNSSMILTDADGSEIVLEGFWITGGGRGMSGPILSSLTPTGDSTLTLRLEGITDLLGNVADPDSLEFWGLDSLPYDSLRVMGIYPEPGGENIPAGGPFSIGFSFWIDMDMLRPLFSLSKVSDSMLVEGSLLRTSGRSFDFVPLHQLMGSEQYRLDLQPGLTTAWGDTLAGFSWTFTSAWGDEPGAVSGRIRGISSEVIIQISHAGESGDPFFRSFLPGDYLFEAITAGRYTVAAFRDRNGNGAWEPGEPYGAYPGVITVYPGLTTEEVDIEILP